MSDAAYERLDEPVAYRSYGEIVERLDRNDENKPRFAIFTGD
jgi:cholesterol oxidase